MSLLGGPPALTGPTIPTITAIQAASAATIKRPSERPIVEGQPEGFRDLHLKIRETDPRLGIYIYVYIWFLKNHRVLTKMSAILNSECVLG